MIYQKKKRARRRSLRRKALEAPAYWIAENAGYDGSLVVEEIRKGDWKWVLKSKGRVC